VKRKIVTAAQAIALIRDGDTVACSGFVGSGTPEELFVALERRFLESGTPRNLTLVFAAAPGDGRGAGLDRLAHPGLVGRAIGGHWGLVPRLAERAVRSHIEAWNLPLGTLSQLFRDIAGHRAGSLTKVGLHTFVDPRQEGGRINARTSEDLVRVMTIDGEEWLFYKSFPVTVALIRATTSDPAGNLTMEREALTLDTLAIAMAARNSGGLVIAQVERIAAPGSLNARQVQVPGVLVDCVVVAEPQHHGQTFGTSYNAAYSAEIRLPADMLGELPLDARKVIARRWGSACPKASPPSRTRSACSTM
jgi:propionate CoA-transferase